MKLLYHSLSTGSSISPFDEAILETATGKPIKIISPYLGLSYLQRLINVSTNWFLISDVEEWLSAAKKERAEALEFIKRNEERIHHYPALHAKAVIGPRNAYLGSANLTASGIQLRTEIGVQLDDPKAILELHAWFDGLWTHTQSPSASELDAFYKQLIFQSKVPGKSEKKLKLSSTSLQIRARLSSPPTIAPNAVEVAKSSLQSTVIEAINIFAGEGFSVKDLFELVSDGSSAVRRGIIQAIYGMCANMVCSAYRLECQQILILDGTIFYQATPLSLQASLEPYDKFLSEVIKQLAFDEPTPISSLKVLASKSGLPTKHASRLIKELSRTGLLFKEGNGKYLLNDEVEWPPSKRFFQFKRAGLAWDAALDRLRCKVEKNPEHLFVPPDPPKPKDSSSTLFSPTQKLEVSVNPIQVKTIEPLKAHSASLRSLAEDEPLSPKAERSEAHENISISEPRAWKSFEQDSLQLQYVTELVPKAKVKPKPITPDDFYLALAQLIQKSGSLELPFSPRKVISHLANELQTTENNIRIAAKGSKKKIRPFHIPPTSLRAVSKAKISFDHHGLTHHPKTAAFIEIESKKGGIFNKLLENSFRGLTERTLERIDLAQARILEMVQADGMLPIQSKLTLYQKLTDTHDILPWSEFQAIATGNQLHQIKSAIRLQIDGRSQMKVVLRKAFPGMKKLFPKTAKVLATLDAQGIRLNYF